MCSSELLPDDKAVVVIITQDDAIHTSILNTLESRKTTALSCNIGWVYSGQLGTICLVLIDTCGSRGVHIQGVLQALEPKAVFVLGFCHEFNDKHLAGDIFICNEVVFCFCLFVGVCVCVSMGIFNNYSTNARWI